MKNKLKLSISILAFLLLIIPVSACQAEILSWEYDPSPAKAGHDVNIVANVKFKVEFGDRDWMGLNLLDPSCRFLAGAAIVPRDDLFAIITEQYRTDCCPGNENFASNAVYIKCTGLNQFGCEETKQVKLTLKAPAEGFCDHCAGQGGNTNPSCSDSPDLYWKGEGIYKIKFGVFKGCYYDLLTKGEQQYTYDLQTRNIEVENPTAIDDVVDSDIDLGFIKIKSWMLLTFLLIGLILVINKKE